MTWFAITLSPIDVDISTDIFDGICADLIDLGASGTAVDCAPLITCYIEGTRLKVDDFTNQLPLLNCKVLSISEVKNENWTGACPDVWETIRAGSIEVVPVESLSDQRENAPNTIRIIPGLGFGTGHHATTRMVLTKLCDWVDDNQKPPRFLPATSVLDIGTGSGILAIAAAKLMGAQVNAIDIDESALDNARDNLHLNGVGHLVKLSTTPLHDITETFQLILANIYGEILMSMASDMSRIAQTGSTAILSGITEIVWGQVWQVYEQRDWQLISEHSEGDWMCAVIKKL